MEESQKYLIKDNVEWKSQTPKVYNLRFYFCHVQETEKSLLCGDEQVVARKEPKGSNGADGHVLLIDLVACAKFKLDTYYPYILCIYFIF